MDIRDLILSGALLGIFLFMVVFIIMNLGKSENIHKGIPFLVIAILFILFNAYNQGEIVNDIIRNFNNSFSK